MQVPDALIDEVRAAMVGCDLTVEQALAKDLAVRLDVSQWELCSALLRLCLAKHPQVKNHLVHLKMRRYRLAVGAQHGVTRSQIENLLVSEAGVEHRLLSFIDIQETQVLVDLPEGMPGEIFSHLQTFKLNGQPLAIRRHAPPRAKSRRRNRGQPKTSKMD